jgi:hypothetical protein
MSEIFPGSCLCGAVRYEVTGPFEVFHLCHCSRCRKATGAAHACNLFTAPENIRWISGQDQAKRFDLPTAKRFSRAFCTECGSGLPYVNRTGTALVVPAGTLDRDPDIAPRDRIFWKYRAAWFDAAASAPAFDEYPE